MKILTPPTKNREILTVVNDILIKTKQKSVKRVRNYDDFEFLRKTFTEMLQKSGFIFLDNGGFKEVYYHKRKYPDFVIKVYHGQGGFRDDTMITKLPRWLRDHFVFPIKKTSLYMIQPKVNNDCGAYKDDADFSLFKKMKTKKKEKIMRNLDITRDNVMFHSGEPVIIDFCA